MAQPPSFLANYELFIHISSAYSHLLPRPSANVLTRMRNGQSDIGSLHLPQRLHRTEGQMDLIREKRWKVQCPVQLFTDDFFVEGWTVDISLHGLRVATVKAIAQGTCVAVRVLEPEGACTVDGVLYTVRWIDKGRIGLEVSEISTAEQQRLRDRLTSLGRSQEPVITSTSPCLTSVQPITNIADTMAALWQLCFPRQHVTSGFRTSLHSLQKSRR